MFVVVTPLSLSLSGRHHAKSRKAIIRKCQACVLLLKLGRLPARSRQIYATKHQPISLRKCNYDGVAKSELERKQTLSKKFF